MAGCNITKSVEFTCEDRKNSAGLQSFGYVCNAGDITLTRGLDDIVEGFTMASTTQMYKFVVPPNSNDAGYEIELADQSGNPSFKHMINAQFSAATQDQLKAIEEMVFATDLVFFMPTKGKNIYVYGEDASMSIESGTQSSGKVGTDNNLHQYTFSGSINEIPPQYLEVDYSSSIAALESALTPAP
jgi:hypothetical protein